MLTSEVRPTEARFELTLAFHCAPALAGIKPADLIALPGEGDETDALLASYSAALAGAGISLRPLCRCRSRCLVLVYRRDRLERQLEQEEVAVCWNGTAIPWPAGWRPCWTIWRPGWRGAVGSPMRWGCSWDIPPRMWRAFCRHGGQGYKIQRAVEGLFRRGEGPEMLPAVRLLPKGPVRPAWRPAAGWSSCFGQLDGDRG